MTRILDRYIFREVTLTWLGVTMVLLLILLTNQFARVLGDVAKGKLPRDAAFDIIGLSAAQYLTLLVPVGLFLSVMLALGRLYRDSEMPAMMACRVGLSGIYRPLLWLLVPLTPAIAWLALEGAPQAMAAVERIGAEARRELDLASIEPGRFTVFGPDQAVVYGESVTPDGDMEKVFIQRRVGVDQIEVVVADRGAQIDVEDEDVRLLVLYNGRRYEGVPGTSQFRVVEFAEYGIPYRLPRLQTDEPKPRTMSFLSLAQSPQPEHIAEAQWRLSAPLATLILCLLAVPLAKSKPRAGRYGRLAVALLVFFIYFNLLSASKAWIEKQVISPALGLWWVHGGVVVVLMALVAYQNNWHKRLLP